MNQFPEFIAALAKRRNYPLKLARMGQGAGSSAVLGASNKFPETVVDAPTERGHTAENISTPPDHAEDVGAKVSKDARWIAEAETKEEGTSRVYIVLVNEQIAKERELSRLKFKSMQKECQEKMAAQASYHASEMAAIQQR